MNLPFIEVKYTDGNGQATWQGLRLREDKTLADFLKKEAADRFTDSQGDADFRAILRGTELTGFGRESLNKVFDGEIPEQRHWAAGEALAEALLVHGRGVILPWNMSRDKRTPQASLPGADIIGFLPSDSECQLVFGEVKSSSESQSPPQVMSGRRGHLCSQLSTLTNDIHVIAELLKWLSHRVKNTDYQNFYQQSVTLFFNSGNKAAVLFGVLIRDTVPNIRDLSKCGEELGRNMTEPTSCELLAVYLPFKLTALNARISTGGAS